MISKACFFRGRATCGRRPKVASFWRPNNVTSRAEGGNPTNPCYFSRKEKDLLISVFLGLIQNFIFTSKQVCNKKIRYIYFCLKIAIMKCMNNDAKMIA